MQLFTVKYVMHPEGLDGTPLLHVHLSPLSVVLLCCFLLYGQIKNGIPKESSHSARMWVKGRLHLKHTLKKCTIGPCCVKVRITYWEHSLYTPGHPEKRLHSHPTSEPPQISPQSSSDSSWGSRLGSTGFLDSHFCSRLPTSRSLSAERSSFDSAM